MRCKQLDLGRHGPTVEAMERWDQVTGRSDLAEVLLVTATSRQQGRWNSDICRTLAPPIDNHAFQSSRRKSFLFFWNLFCIRNHLMLKVLSAKKGTARNLIRIRECCGWLDFPSAAAGTLKLTSVFIFYLSRQPPVSLRSYWFYKPKRPGGFKQRRHFRWRWPPLWWSMPSSLFSPTSKVIAQVKRN